jgi:hypothetical protein
MNDQRTDRDDGRLIDRIRGAQSILIFIIAEWSGPAEWALKRFKELIDAHGIPSDHVLYVSADNEDEINSVPELCGRIGGAGEVAVIRNGRVVLLANLGGQRELLNQRWEEVLEAYHGAN